MYWKKNALLIFPFVLSVFVKALSCCSRSMNDLDGEQKTPNSPSDRPKFHLKFPQFSLHNSMHPSSMPEKDAIGIYNYITYIHVELDVIGFMKKAYIVLLHYPVIVVTDEHFYWFLVLLHLSHQREPLQKKKNLYAEPRLIRKLERHLLNKLLN